MFFQIWSTGCQNTTKERLIFICKCHLDPLHLELGGPSVGTSWVDSVLITTWSIRRLFFIRFFFVYLMISQNFAPIWLPHWPAWRWTISLMSALVRTVRTVRTASVLDWLRWWYTWAGLYSQCGRQDWLHSHHLCRHSGHWSCPSRSHGKVLKF